MTHEELDNYIKENLRLEVIDYLNTARHGSYAEIKLVFKDEVISFETLNLGE